MTTLSCSCGAVRLEARREPIISVECCCTSCRAAGTRLETLPGASQVLTRHATTPFVLYRKDRVTVAAGAGHLAAFRLSPDASTRRVVATCCYAPLWLDFQAGHWLSLYGTLWPEGTRPPLEMRTMAKDLPEGATLPDDASNARTHSLGFMAKLLGAWIAMGFRSPKFDIEETLDA